MRKKINMRKLRDELLCMAVIIMGVLLLVCNFFKITPGMENPLAVAITTVIAYGSILGTIFVVLGIGTLVETIHTPYPHSRKKRL